jgi:hypothetical protein
MKKFVLVIISVLTLLIVISGCEFFYDTFILYKQYLGDVKITLTLEDLSQELTFNQGPTPTTVEYAWRVFIDTDNNLGTGSGGFDVQIELEFLSNTLNTEVLDQNMTGTISRWNLAAWESTDDTNIFRDGNTLYFGADSTNSLFANLNPNYRTSFSTEHHTGVIQVTDVIDDELITGNGTGTDPIVDSSLYPFINIIEVEIEFP